MLKQPCKLRKKNILRVAMQIFLDVVFGCTFCWIFSGRAGRDVVQLLNGEKILEKWTKTRKFHINFLFYELSLPFDKSEIYLLK